MLERAAHLVGGDVGGLWGGTFHHAANRMLRRHAPLLGYGSDYTILDEDDSLRLIKACIAELGLKDKKFPKPKVLVERVRAGGEPGGRRGGDGPRNISATTRWISTAC
jgi:DNA helicase II / ATP-dependent DNA helicase PcrA